MIPGTQKWYGNPGFVPQEDQDAAAATRNLCYAPTGTRTHFRSCRHCDQRACKLALLRGGDFLHPDCRLALAEHNKPSRSPLGIATLDELRKCGARGATAGEMRTRLQARHDRETAAGDAEPLAVPCPHACSNALVRLVERHMATATLDGKRQRYTAIPEQTQ
jgi:hypothetical protein